MTDTIEVEPNQSLKIERKKSFRAVRAAKHENVSQPDQINYDMAPLEGPVIYLKHIVSDR